MLELTQEAVARLEATVNEIKSQHDSWLERLVPGWDLLANNMPEWVKMMKTMKEEGGFVGAKSYETNPLGTQQQAFEQLLEENDELGKQVMNIMEDMDMDH